MALSSEAHPGWRFTIRYKLRLFACFECGASMKKRDGLLRISKRGLIQWHCPKCAYVREIIGR